MTSLCVIILKETIKSKFTEVIVSLLLLPSLLEPIRESFKFVLDHY